MAGGSREAMGRVCVWVKDGGGQRNSFARSKGSSMGIPLQSVAESI